jgi:hypothetical protein
MQRWGEQDPRLLENKRLFVRPNTWRNDRAKRIRHAVRRILKYAVGCGAIASLWVFTAAQSHARVGDPSPSFPAVWRTVQRDDGNRELACYWTSEQRLWGLVDPAMHPITCLLETKGGE